MSDPAPRIRLRIGVALAVAVIAALVLLEITDEVVEDDATQFDHAISLWLSERPLPKPVWWLLKGISELGTYPFAVVFTIAVVVWAWRKKHRYAAGVLLIVALLGRVLNILFKTMIGRARPDLFPELIEPASYSFPSGHAMGSAAAYGMAAVVIARVVPRLTVPLAIATPLLVLAIGATRVLLGVHWTTDVLAGTAAGGLLVVGGWLAIERRHLRLKPGESVGSPREDAVHQQQTEEPITRASPRPPS